MYTRGQETHLSPYRAPVEEGTEREGKAGEVEIEPPGATAVFARRSDHQAGRTLSSAPTWFPIQEQILGEATKNGVPALAPKRERILRQGSVGMQRSSGSCCHCSSLSPPLSSRPLLASCDSIMVKTLSGPSGSELVDVRPTRGKSIGG